MNESTRIHERREIRWTTKKGKQRCLNKQQLSHSLEQIMINFLLWFIQWHEAKNKHEEDSKVAQKGRKDKEEESFLFHVRFDFFAIMFQGFFTFCCSCCCYLWLW